MYYLCTRKRQGALVQLVRIHACHAWGHGFESRTHRTKSPATHWSGGSFCFLPAESDESQTILECAPL